jgi:hypothetical protein
MTNEEFEREIKLLEEQIEDKINSLRIKFLESNANKKSYEVEVPEDIENYYYVDADGLIESLISYSDEVQKGIFKRGLAFKTKEEAEQFDKERILINRAKDWAKKYNEGWTPNWDESGEKYSVEYDNSLGNLEFDSYYVLNLFSKLPYFKSEKIAEQFIKEFGEEIKEVLC